MLGTSYERFHTHHLIGNGLSRYLKIPKNSNFPLENDGSCERCFRPLLQDSRTEYSFIFLTLSLSQRY